MKVLEEPQHLQGVAELSRSWSVSAKVVEQALEYRPHAVMLSFGDPRPLAEPVLAAGVRLMIQVTNLYEAAMAVELAADVIVAQGAEAGGHARARHAALRPSSRRSCLPHPCARRRGHCGREGNRCRLRARRSRCAHGDPIPSVRRSTRRPPGDQGDHRGSRRGHRAKPHSRHRTGCAVATRYPARTLRNAFLDRWRGREAALEADRDPGPPCARRRTGVTCPSSRYGRVRR